MNTYNDLSYFASLNSGYTDLPIYGIVTDATRIQWKPQNMKYATTIRIIDSTWSQESHPVGYVPFIKVLFIGNNKNDIPDIKQLGAIIKFNGGLLRVIKEDEYKTIAFLWNKGNEKGYWKIIDENPIDDIEKIKSLRDFARNYFEKQILMELTQNLSTARATNEVSNIIVKVIKVKEEKKLEDSYKLIKVMDHTDKAYLVISEAEKEEFSYIQIQDFILIKGARYTDLATRRIELRENGNIIRLPNYLKLLNEYQSTINIFINETTIETVIEEKKLMTPIEVSIVKNNSLPISSLKIATDANALYGMKYRVKVYVIEMGPEDIRQWVKGYCDECKKFFDLTIRDEVSICNVCKGIGRMVYQVQLFVKDKELRDDPEIYRILLWTHDGKGEDFFGEKPVNCYRSEYLYKKLEAIYKKLTQYNVYLDCIVERMGRGTNTFIQINDTIINSIT